MIFAGNVTFFLKRVKDLQCFLPQMSPYGIFFVECLKTKMYLIANFEGYYIIGQENKNFKFLTIIFTTETIMAIFMRFMTCATSGTLFTFIRTIIISSLQIITNKNIPFVWFHISGTIKHISTTNLKQQQLGKVSWLFYWSSFFVKLCNFM